MRWTVKVAASAIDVDHGEAAAVERDEPLGEDVADELARRAEGDDVVAGRPIDRDDLGGAVDVPGQLVAADLDAGSRRALDVDAVAGAQAPERGASLRLVDGVEGDAVTGRSRSR